MLMSSHDALYSCKGRVSCLGFSLIFLLGLLSFVALNVFWQVMNRVHDHDENHRLIEHQSILRGGSLSLLFSAIYLLPLDKFARKHHLDYVRYMADVFFFKKRHQLKKIMKKIYACLTALKLTLAAPKIWIGRVGKGFDYLGYQISPNGVAIATHSLDRLQQRFYRLLEQNTSELCWVKYVKNWIRWVTTGESLMVTPLNTNIASLLLDNFGWRLHV